MLDRRTLSPIILGVAFFLLTAASTWLMSLSEGVPVVWPAPAILLAYLAARPKKMHRMAVISCGIGGMLGMILFGWSPQVSFLMTAINLIDEIGAFWLLGKLRRGRFDWFESLNGVLSFVLVAGIISPLALAVPAALLGGTPADANFGTVCVAWFFGDSLAALVLTPLVWLALSGQLALEIRSKSHLEMIGVVALLAVVAISATGVFLQPTTPLLLLPFFPILMSAFKAERLGAVLSLIILSHIGIAATYSGLGPIAAMTGSSSWGFRALQLYLATAMMSALPAAVSLQQRRLAAEELRLLVQRLSKSELKAHNLANTDALTGLANRRYFLAELERAVSERRAFTLTIMDLNSFKEINDYWGHVVGDQILKYAGERFRHAMGSSAVLARLGGDEFAAIVFQPSRSDADRLGHRIVAALEKPILIGRKSFRVSAACGLVYAGVGGTHSSARLVARADAAMYHAKRNPDQRFVLYSSSLGADEERKVKIHDALCQPVQRGGIYPVYQPIYNLDSGALVSLEALARWDLPGLGVVPPGEFIPIAERTRVIPALTWELLTQVMGDAVHWPDHVSLSFNACAAHISTPGFVGELLHILREGGLAPHRLKLEITETAQLADSDRAMENCGILQQRGVRIVLDDFGAGYASVSYLRSMRFDEIKLDSSLTLNARKEEGLLLAKGVIKLCEALQVPCTAEHLEGFDDVSRFAELGCRYGQGFCLQEPVAAEKVAMLEPVLASLHDTGRRVA